MTKTTATVGIEQRVIEGICFLEEGGIDPQGGSKNTTGRVCVDNRDLSVLFPDLGWISRAAETFLRKCQPGNLPMMLQERKILVVNIVGNGARVLINNTGGLSIVDKGFVINVCCCQKDPDSRCKAMTAILVGEAIAHTFHHNLTYNPPKDILGSEFRWGVISFSASFATRWIERVGLDVICKHFRIGCNEEKHTETLPDPPKSSPGGMDCSDEASLELS